MRLLIVSLILLPASLFSQYKVTVILDTVPANTSGSIYIAGNFNNWDAADPNTAFSKNAQGKYEKVFDDVRGGTYEFKFTLGSNANMECRADGSDMANRTLVLTSDTVVHTSIAAWKPVKKSNALAPAGSMPVIDAQPYLAIATSRSYLFIRYGKVHGHDLKI